MITEIKSEAEYTAALQRIRELMDSATAQANNPADDAELSALADLVVVYEATTIWPKEEQ